MSKELLQYLKWGLCSILASIWLSARAEVSALDTASQQTPAIIAATQQLAIERERNEVASDRLKELTRDKQRLIQNIRAERIEQADINRAELDIAMAQADLNAVNLTVDDIQQNIDSIKRNIQELENQYQDVNIPTTNSGSIGNLQVAQIQQNLNQQRALLKIQQARLKNLTLTQAIIKKRLEIQNEWRNRLQLLHQTYEYEKRKQSLEQLELSVQAQQQQWLKKLAVLNQQMKALEEQGLTETPAYARLTLHILEAEERSNLSHLDLVAARLTNQLQNMGIRIQREQSITEWNNVSAEIDTIITSLQKAQELIHGKISLIKQHEQIGSKGKASGIIDAKELKANLNLLRDIAEAYQERETVINNLASQAESYHKIINKSLRSALAKRQGLPGLNVDQWLNLGQKIAQFPPLVLQAVKATQQQLISGIKALDAWRLGGLILIEICWCMLMFWLNPRLQRIVSYYHDHIHGAAANSIYVILELVRRNYLGLTIGIGVTILFYVVGISNKIFTLVFYLAIVWFSFKSLKELVKISVFENIEDKSKRDIRFYKRLKFIIMLGGLLTTFIVLTRQLPVQYEVEDIFNRFFMLFLLFISILLFKGNRIVSHLFTPYILGAPHYFKKIIRLLNILIPLVMFSTAVVGLVGYVELAWTIFRYEGKFLLVLTFYLILKGVLREIIERISTVLIRNSRNGWLWSESLLKPLDNIVKILTFLFAWYILFLAYGLDQHSFIVVKLNEIIRMRLFSLAGGDINFLILLELIIVLGVLLWIAKWSREFAHRWLFASIKDVGLRNSLAVFTQYTLVTIGIFICLKIIGINLFALTAVAGAFAFGVGLGLRDLANNFVCGILLLIERPLRKGDLVTIGGYEGEVTHIGMRSIIVYTSDLTEAMVPNSEAFSKTFVNWTLRHHIVRGVIQLRISPHDNPHLVQEELIKTMQNTPGVVTNPPAEVYFKEMHNGLLDFEARYYINLKLTVSRSEMRSKVLFAIWDCFERLGIKVAPQAEQDINIKSVPEALAMLPPH